MTRLLDTRLVEPGTRADAIHAAFDDASSPAAVHLDGGVQATLDAWELGPGATLLSFAVRAPELRLERLARHLRRGTPERFSVAVSVVGSCATSNRDLVLTSNRSLRPTDMTSEYRIRQRGTCRAVAFEVDHARLGLPVDEVRAALPHVGCSPLHDLVRRHLLDLADAADRLDETAAALAGSATVDLLRALLRPAGVRERHDETAVLTRRIEDYVAQHLADPDLTPARIAAAHHVSLRRLYLLLADRAETPAAWVVRRRLDAAHDDLRHGRGTVSQVARRWGFADPAHFSRRFKAAFGASPSEVLRARGRP